MSDDVDIYADDPAKEANDAASEEARKLREAYRRTFLGTEDGRKVLAHLLGYTMVLSSTYTGNSKTFFNEGARATGLLILENLGLGGASNLAQLLATGAAQ